MRHASGTEPHLAAALEQLLLSTSLRLSTALVGVVGLSAAALPSIGAAPSPQASLSHAADSSPALHQRCGVQHEEQRHEERWNQ